MRQSGLHRIVVMAVFCLSPLHGQIPPIGILDFYGLGTVSEQQLRNGLPFQEGDVLDVLDHDSISSLESKLAATLGVARVRINPVCCDDTGKVIVYVGVQDASISGLEYRPTSTGEVALPSEVLQTYRDFGLALMDAVRAGDASDDLSQGHSLMGNPAARALQERFLVYAKLYGETLRHALRDSAYAEYRATAAQVLGYAENKMDVTEDLQQAVLDPDENVRNNAARSLAAIAVLAEQRPELRTAIRADLFITMLNSVVWSDRNKALMVLHGLTKGRDRQLLDRIRQEALPSLVEMSRWKYNGHALGAYVILGRIVGLPEDEIWSARTLAERETTIGQALQLPER